LRPVLDLVLTDLQKPDPVAFRIGWTAETAVSGTVLFEEAGEGTLGITGVHVVRADWATIAVHLADQLQEQVFPETRAAWGQARPSCRCPGHAHPAEPVMCESTAWWICPRTHAALWPFGDVT
jgi:hypothetical protein